MGKLGRYKRKLQRDAWDLDKAFFHWLEERLPVYLKDAGKNIVLTEYKQEYNGKEYTQEDAIKYMIELLKSLHSLDEWSQEYKDTTDKLLDLWKQWISYMWW